MLLLVSGNFSNVQVYIDSYLEVYEKEVSTHTQRVGERNLQWPFLAKTRSEKWTGQEGKQ